MQQVKIMETQETNSELINGCSPMAPPTIEIYKARVLHLLRTSETAVPIAFNKVDGSIRQMNATLNPDLITSTYEKTTDRVKEVNPDVQAVFDIDAGSFRSFRWDSLLEVRFP